MFEFLTFEWLIQLIYIFAKISGFLFISVDFDSSHQFAYKICWNYTLISLALSYVATSFSVRFSVAQITHSEMMDDAAGLLTKVTIWFPLVFKIFFITQGQKFFSILLSFQWCHKKV